MLSNSRRSGRNRCNATFNKSTIVATQPTQIALKTLLVPGSANLGQLVLSNGTAPQLEQLDLSSCGSSQYVFVQSAALQVLRLQDCTALNKVRHMSFVGVVMVICTSSKCHS